MNISKQDTTHNKKQQSTKRDTATTQETTNASKLETPETRYKHTSSQDATKHQ